MADETPDSGPKATVVGWRVRCGAPLLIGLAAVLVHAGAIRGGLYESDEWLVLNLGQTYAAAPAAAMVGAAEPDITRFPLRRLLEIPLWTALHGLLGYSAPAYRGLAVVLHALAAVLVLLLARRLRLPEELAVCAGLLFAVYPKSWEATAVLSSIPWPLVTVLLLGSLLLLMSHREYSRPALALTASALLLGLALFLRGAVAVMLPAVMVLDLARRKGWRFWRNARAWLPLLPHLLLAGSVALIILFDEIELTAGGVPPGDLAVLGAPGQMLWTLLVSLPASLLCLADPARLPGLTGVAIGWAALAVGLVLAAALTRRMPWRAAGFGLSWLALILVPLIVVVAPGEWGDARYFYLASVGLVLLVASGLAALDRWRRVQRLVAAALLLMPAVATVVAEFDLFEREAPARKLAESVAALVRNLPAGSRVLLLEGRPEDRNALEAAMLAAWLARPAGGLSVVQVERPRVCAIPAAARPALAAGAVSAVYWSDEQYVSSDLGTAARLLAARGCTEPPGPDDVPIAALPGDPAGRILIGRWVERPGFYEYAVRH